MSKKRSGGDEKRGVSLTAKQREVLKAQGLLTSTTNNEPRSSRLSNSSVANHSSRNTVKQLETLLDDYNKQADDYNKRAALPDSVQERKQIVDQIAEAMRGVKHDEWIQASQSQHHDIFKKITELLLRLDVSQKHIDEIDRKPPSKGKTIPLEQLLVVARKLDKKRASEVKTANRASIASVANNPRGSAIKRPTDGGASDKSSRQSGSNIHALRKMAARAPQAAAGKNWVHHTFADDAITNLIKNWRAELRTLEKPGMTVKDNSSLTTATNEFKAELGSIVGASAGGSGEIRLTKEDMEQLVDHLCKTSVSNPTALSEGEKSKLVVKLHKELGEMVQNAEPQKMAEFRREQLVTKFGNVRSQQKHGQKTQISDKLKKQIVAKLYKDFEAAASKAQGSEPNYTSLGRYVLEEMGAGTPSETIGIIPAQNLVKELYKQFEILKKAKYKGKKVTVADVPRASSKDRTGEPDVDVGRPIDSSMVEEAEPSPPPIDELPSHESLDPPLPPKAPKSLHRSSSGRSEDGDTASVTSGDSSFLDDSSLPETEEPDSPRHFSPEPDSPTPSETLRSPKSNPSVAERFSQIKEKYSKKLDTIEAESNERLEAAEIERRREAEKKERQIRILAETANTPLPDDENAESEVKSPPSLRRVQSEQEEDTDYSESLNSMFRENNSSDQGTKIEEDQESLDGDGIYNVFKSAEEQADDWLKDMQEMSDESFDNSLTKKQRRRIESGALNGYDPDEDDDGMSKEQDRLADYQNDLGREMSKVELVEKRQRAAEGQNDRAEAAHKRREVEKKEKLKFAKGQRDRAEAASQKREALAAEKKKNTDGKQSRREKVLEERGRKEEARKKALIRSRRLSAIKKKPIELPELDVSKVDVSDIKQTPQPLSINSTPTAYYPEIKPIENLKSIDNATSGVVRNLDVSQGANSSNKALLVENTAKEEEKSQQLKEKDDNHPELILDKTPSPEAKLEKKSAKILPALKVDNHQGVTVRRNHAFSVNGRVLPIQPPSPSSSVVIDDHGVDGDDSVVGKKEDYESKDDSKKMDKKVLGGTNSTDPTHPASEPETHASHHPTNSAEVSAADGQKDGGVAPTRWPNVKELAQQYQAVIDKNRESITRIKPDGKKVQAAQKHVADAQAKAAKQLTPTPRSAASTPRSPQLDFSRIPEVIQGRYDEGLGPSQTQNDRSGDEKLAQILQAEENTKAASQMQKKKLSGDVTPEPVSHVGVSGSSEPSTLSVATGSSSDFIVEAVRKHILDRQQNLLQQHIVTQAQNAKEQDLSRYVEPESFRAYMRTEPGKNRVKAAMADPAINAAMEKVENTGHSAIKSLLDPTTGQPAFRDAIWDPPTTDAPNQSAIEINDPKRGHVCSLSSTIHTRSIAVGAKGEVQINKYRTIDFPTAGSKNTPTNGPLHLIMHAQDADGNPHDSLGVTVHYAKDGKLVEFSSPAPIKFMTKDQSAVGYIEHGGEIYTLPITQGKYQEMMLEVARNKGHAVDLAQQEASYGTSTGKKANRSSDRVRAGVGDKFEDRLKRSARGVNFNAEEATMTSPPSPRVTRTTKSSGRDGRN